jgi:hypothetical protein
MVGSSDTLVILWISADGREAADMAFQYARDSLLKGWWKQVELLIWGPSVELLCENEDVQTQVAMLSHVGVNITACVACAVQYRAVEALARLGVQADGTGEKLTALLKSGAGLMTL